VEELKMDEAVVAEIHLPLSGVSGIARDQTWVWLYTNKGLVHSDGATWLNGNAGAVRIEASDLNRATSDPTFIVPVRAFGDDDGLPGSAQNDSSSLVQTTDGKLWFAQEDGLAWVDPKSLRRNMRVPTIVIRTVAAQNVTVTPDGPLILPAKTTNVRIFTDLQRNVAMVYDWKTTALYDGSPETHLPTVSALFSSDEPTELCIVARGTVDIRAFAR
jgi:ligand-binding sensor domain-containing protein